MGLYFIRHGESQANEQNLFAGRYDSPLTDLGRCQAEQAGKEVTRLGIIFDEIHVSTLSRAQETASVINQLLAQKIKPRLVVSASLIERDFGILSEKNKSLIKKRYGAHEYEKMFHSSCSAPPEGELFSEMHSRSKAYYENALLPKSIEGKNILVVSHKYIIEMFALISANMPIEQYYDFKIPNSKPNSWVDLGKSAKRSMRGMNTLGEEIEARLPTLLLFGVLLGMGLKLALKINISSFLLACISTLFLAVNAYIAFIRVETNVILNIRDCFPKIWKGTLLRTLVGVILVYAVGGPIGWAAGTFCLLPPAMTAPTLSLMWGGDYFLSVQSTLLLSIISPIILLTISKIGMHLDVKPFLVMLCLAGIFPALLAQARRKLNPIQSGALATNWGWVGGASLIPLSAFTGYSFTSTHFSHDLFRDGFFALLLFAGIYILGAIASQLSSGNSSLKRDIFITHTVPNLFFWMSLLPLDSKNGAIPLFTALLFFVSIWAQEKFHVHRFANELIKPSIKIMPIANIS